MLAVFSKEINAFLSSLVGYVVMAVFLVAMGLLVWVFPGNSIPDSGYADLSPFFRLAPYVFLFLMPALTMRTFAEERRTGTLELLLTRPVGVGSIVVGKFLAVCVLLLLTLLPTLLYYFSVYRLGNPPGNLDSAGTFGSYLGLLLLGAVFAAIGLFTSALTDSQIVAFLLGVFGCFLLYVGLGSLAGPDVLGGTGYWLGWLGLDSHYNALGRGLIDSRNVVYLLSWVVLALVGTATLLQRRK